MKPAKTIHLRSYPKVTYYTVLLDEDDETLFDRFVTAHEASCPGELDHLTAWVKALGEDFGALESYFRYESDGDGGIAHGLPPPAANDNTINPLRLYGYRYSDNLVFLFGGAIKRSKTGRARDCMQVRPHFLLANSLGKALRSALGKGRLKLRRNVSLREWELNPDEFDFTYEK